MHLATLASMLVPHVCVEKQGIERPLQELDHGPWPGRNGLIAKPAGEGFPRVCTLSGARFHSAARNGCAIRLLSTGSSP